MNEKDFVGLCVLTTAGVLSRIPDYLGTLPHLNIILLFYKLSWRIHQSCLNKMGVD